MNVVILRRDQSDDEGTFGVLDAFAKDGGLFSFQTLELPWRENAKGVSCVPAGDYVFRWRTDSPKHGECYEADPDAEAPGRTNIQIHAANLAGDEAKGWKAELLGCIALGLKRGSLDIGGRRQSAVLSSKQAVRQFADLMERKAFQLSIRWDVGVGPRGA